MISKLSGLIGALLVSLVVSAAFASSADAGTFTLNGYPCRVNSAYATGTYTVTMYTGPACTGSFIATLQPRSTFWGGADGYSQSLLGPMVSATASDTRISGTYTTSSLFGITSYLFDDIAFNSN